MALMDDVDVRVILLTGAGEKAFAAGADINELMRLDIATGEAKSGRGQEVFRIIETCGKPVIALHQWVCAGRRVRIGDGVHDAAGQRYGQAGAAGGEAGADSGIWRDAATAAAGRAVGGAEDVADGGDDWGGGGFADWAGG